MLLTRLTLADVRNYASLEFARRPLGSTSWPARTRRRRAICSKRSRRFTFALARRQYLYGADFGQHVEFDPMATAAKLDALARLYRRAGANTLDAHHILLTFEKLAGDENQLIRFKTAVAAKAHPDKSLGQAIQRQIKVGRSDGDLDLMEILILMEGDLWQTFDRMEEMVGGRPKDATGRARWDEAVTRMTKLLAQTLKKQDEAYKQKLSNFLITRAQHVKGENTEDMLSLVYGPIAEYIYGKGTLAYNQVMVGIWDVKATGITHDEHLLLYGSNEEQERWAVNDLFINYANEPRARKVLAEAIKSTHKSIVIEIWKRTFNEGFVFGPQKGEREPLVLATIERLSKEKDPDLVTWAVAWLSARREVGASSIAEAYRGTTDQWLKMNILGKYWEYNKTLSMEFAHDVVGDWAGAIKRRINGVGDSQQNDTDIDRYNFYVNQLSTIDPARMRDEINVAFIATSSDYEILALGDKLQEKGGTLPPTVRLMYAIASRRGIDQAIDALLNGTSTDRRSPPPNLPPQGGGITVEVQTDPYTLPEPDLVKLFDITLKAPVDEQAKVIPYLGKVKVKDNVNLSKFGRDKGRDKLIDLYKGLPQAGQDSEAVKKATLTALAEKGDPQAGNDELSREAFAQLMAREEDQAVVESMLTWSGKLFAGARV